MYITNFLNSFQGQSATLQNQHERISLIGVLVQQCNVSYQKDKDGVVRYWAQLLCNFKSSYSRTDEKGELHNDNSSIRTLVIKFPMSYLEKNKLSTNDLKSFFDEYFVQKKFLILPVTEEKQSYQFVNDKRTPIKNQTEVIINQNFNLSSFIDEVKNDKKAGGTKA